MCLVNRGVRVDDGKERERERGLLSPSGRDDQKDGKTRGEADGDYFFVHSFKQTSKRVRD